MKTGSHITPEHKRKISQARKGKRLSAEHRLKFLAGTKRYLEEHYRIHGHHPNKGRRPVAGFHKGSHPATEFKKGNKLWVGRHHTESSKRRLSQALMGRRLPDEVRGAISRGHMGQVPWNMGLTKETSPSVAQIGIKQSLSWTPEKRRWLSENNRRRLPEWWRQHPDAKERLVKRQRPTMIELFARDSLSKRNIAFVVNKWVEDLCIPDLVIPDRKIAIFCHGCFWHACPEHSPVVPAWLRNKIKDKEIRDTLEKRGWRVLEVWEHEFKINKDAAWEKLQALTNESQGGD